MIYFGEIFSAFLESPIITDARVIVLEGPRNSGKTQFAEQIAAQLRSEAPEITDVFYTSVDFESTRSAERKRIERLVSSYDTFQEGEACLHCDMAPTDINVRQLVLVMDYTFYMHLELVTLLQNPNITLILMTQESHADMDEMRLLDPSCYLYCNPNTHQFAVWKNGELILEYDASSDQIERADSPPPPPSSPFNETWWDDRAKAEIRQIEDIKRYEQSALRALSGNELTKLRRKESNRMPGFYSLSEVDHSRLSAKDHNDSITWLDSESSRRESIAWLGSWLDSKELDPIQALQKTMTSKASDLSIAGPLPLTTSRPVAPIRSAALERFIEKHLQYQKEANTNEKQYEMVAPIDKCWEDVWFSIDQ